MLKDSNTTLVGARGQRGFKLAIPRHNKLFHYLHRRRAANAPTRILTAAIISNDVLRATGNVAAEMIAYARRTVTGKSHFFSLHSPTLK